MSSNDTIKLPTLPDIPAALCAWKHSEGIAKKLLESYATTAIESDRQTNKNLTHYMPEVIAALKATGCNESLVADIEKAVKGGRDRQARGEPVAWLVYVPSEETQRVYDSRDDPGFIDDITNAPDLVITPLYTAPQPPQIPEGYALVPIEPTDRMLGAALHHIDGMACMPAAYKAMLEAAPQPKDK